jgi:dihydroflavonol-4-reductase
MKVFLTGGTGFIGQALVQALHKRNWPVTALVRKPESAGSQQLRSLGAELVRGDITDRASMVAPIQDAQVVIHNAAWYEVGISKRARAQMTAINVQGAANVLGLAAEVGVPRIVHVSSIVAFGATGEAEMADERRRRRYPPFSHYEQTKAQAHEIALQYQQQGAPVMIACPAGVIGPGDHSPLGHLARMYVRGRLTPITFGLRGNRAHVHVDDCAEAIALIAEKGAPGEAYILSNGVLRNEEMLAIWTRTPGGLKPLLEMPKWLAVAMCGAAEPVQRALGLPVVFSREMVHNSYAHFRYSAAKVEQELGMQFRSIEQAFLDTLAAERAIAQNGE